MTIQQQIQNLDITYGYVELYTLDCSQIGGSIFRFSPNLNSDGTGLVWQGNTYTPLPITTAGWEIDGTGNQVKPTLTVSNVNKVLLAAVISLGDVVGAQLIRVRTFANFLDNGATPDPSQTLPPDIFVIDQKTGHDNTQITWALASVIDRFGMQLPGRQVLRDFGFPGVGVYRTS